MGTPLCKSIFYENFSGTLPQKGKVERKGPKRNVKYCKANVLLLWDLVQEPNTLWVEAKDAVEFS
jgi:hypothetical protein